MSSNSDSQVQFNSEDSEIKPESLSSISKKSKKIKNKVQKQTNWNPGRPGKPSISQLPIDQFQVIKSSMKNIWFCTDISMRCLIYLCKKGNMILKVKTGKPAETVKKEFLDLFGKTNLKSYKKFKKEFKKKLKVSLSYSTKEKNAAILQHLGYSEQTTYLFLSNNDGDQIDLKLECVTNETKQGLLSLIRYLSPQFTYTYKVIVECFYSLLAMSQQEEDNQFNINNIVESIVEKLKSDKKNHKMIFDMQLIQELLLGDYVLMNEIENEPEQAVLHLRSNEGVNLPNFTANSYKDQVESIEQYSNWINTFIREFVEILKQYQ
ncbi:unnamed protein product (macronuclear) [Paramecium tetraurelia]|uniref:Uncharacterized protein n=1 Tax=Paramecium tetraurelia TaxID=5888 RepID=A0DSN8_PARTE|nr:uncharacterized protein GSPATT00019748001 [Paramecium tetraurelia]CAK86055.1 unnamed protein product [Paramecium tetraurelia]|eukprot:XP_001453452.1 hypothetical protein (macronuclear) [Paramecium tetraurelia strain d4-2]